MAQHNNIGVFQLPNGNWAYRFTQTVNGKRHNHKSVKDENGEPMKSQKAAIRARQLAIMAAEARKNRTHAAEDNIRRSLSRVLWKGQERESLYYHPQAGQSLEKSSFCKIRSAFYWYHQRCGSQWLSCRIVLYRGTRLPLCRGISKNVLSDFRSGLFPQLPWCRQL